MSKLKELREKRATIFGQIDELRKATDGRAMTAEEQQKWDALLKDYESADQRVKQEERFQDMEMRQLEQSYHEERSRDGASARLGMGGKVGGGYHASLDGQDRTLQHPDPEYRSAFIDYLINGEGTLTNQTRALFEKRAGLPGVSGGVLVPKLLGDKVEVALKNFGGMFAAGSVFYTAKGGDLTMPTVNDTARRAIIVTEYAKTPQSAPVFGSKIIKAFTIPNPHRASVGRTVAGQRIRSGHAVGRIARNKFLARHQRRPHRRRRERQTARHSTRRNRFKCNPGGDRHQNR